MSCLRFTEFLWCTAVFNREPFLSHGRQPEVECILSPSRPFGRLPVYNCKPMDIKIRVFQHFVRRKNNPGKETVNLRLTSVTQECLCVSFLYLVRHWLIFSVKTKLLAAWYLNVWQLLSHSHSFVENNYPIRIQTGTNRQGTWIKSHAFKIIYEL